MSEDSKDDQLAQFQSITGADVDRARFFLESSGWKLEVAMSAFFENGDEEGGDGGDGGVGNVGNVGSANREEEEEGQGRRMDSASGPSSSSAGAPAARPAPPPSSGEGGRFRTMDSMRGRDKEEEEEDSDDDDEEEGQAFFAGGSTQSGQQILGPPKKKGADFVSQMFKMARESGAEAVEAGSSSSSGASGGRAGAFAGSAFRLGSEDTSSEYVPSRAPQRPAPPREFTLKMWSNGFSVDDGELRAYNDPGNREFLASVMTGRIPQELVREARGGEVHVNMEDHKTEEYVKPKVSSKPFSGQGHVLGGTVPEVVGAGAATAAAAATPSSASDNASGEAAAKERANVDPSKPTTNIQVRLNDGSRLVVRLNHSHTVGDLREFVSLARPHLAASPFNLLTTFPSKVLEDDSATLESAGLLNAAVMLRLK